MMVAVSGENTEATVTKNKMVFYQFIADFEKRKNMSFVLTFPDLEEYWFECEKARNTFLRTQKKY